MTVSSLLLKIAGGAGSGNWGHAGIPGHRGGSVARSTAMSRTSGKDWQARQDAAKKSNSVVELAGGKVKVYGASPDQIKDIQDVLDKVPEWHLGTVNEKVSVAYADRWRGTPQHGHLVEHAKSLNKGPLEIKFEGQLGVQSKNILTGKGSEIQASYLPNSITLNKSVKGQQLKEDLSHELGHHVSFLSPSSASNRDIKMYIKYTHGGERIGGAVKRDQDFIQNRKGILGVNHPDYQRLNDGMKAISKTAGYKYNDYLNNEEKFAESYSLALMGKKNILTPSVGKYVSKFMNKKPPAGIIDESSLY